MLKRRNLATSIMDTKGYIRNYFGPDITRILTSNDRVIHNIEVPYVHHYEAEAVLSDYMIADPEIDKSLMFTGLTGSGKSSIIRHVFGLEENENPNDFSQGRVIIHVDFNRAHNTAQDGILSSIRAAVDSICEEFGIDYPDTVNRDFYEFIKTKCRKDCLHLDGKHGRATSYQERMNTYNTKMPVSFASCQLQYVMSHSLCNLKLVVLVVDNIEGFLDRNAKDSKAKYLSPVIEAFKLADCIVKRQSPTDWRFNMVISCRHHIWRILTGEYSDNSFESTLLQSYVTTGIPYDLTNPVKVSDIVEKREEVFSKRQRNPERWTTAVNVVNTVLKTVDGQIGDFILQLELKDLRKSFSKLQELILHRGLQRVTDEQIVAGAFQIDSVEQFDLTRVNIIRIIGLGNNRYYSNESSIIPNLLHNDPMGELDLFPLLTLKYFLRLSHYSEPTWENRIYIPDFYQEILQVFDNNVTSTMTMFERSVEFLIRNRLLLRSADQPQEEAPGLSSTEIRNIEYVYVSGAAVVLWKELEKSSALFQLFLDDIWLEDGSDFFSENGNDIEHCVTYLKTLLQKEQRIYNEVSNLGETHEQNYLNMFGCEPVCRQLVKGLISSLEAIRRDAKDSRTHRRISAALNSLGEANQLKREIDNWKGERESIYKRI